MFLAVDIGNTSITLGLAEDKSFLKIFRVNSDVKLDYKEILSHILKGIKINGCIISSVVTELNTSVKNAIYELFKISPIFLNKNQIDIGIKIKTPNPEETGADRIANVYAAKVLYGFPAIVVDVGTATTFDIIDENGDFSGGIIMPGIRTQLKSLCQNTSLLPDVEPQSIDKVIGNDTISSILSGVIRGHAAAIDGLLKECIKELNKGNIKIIGTGGDFELVSQYMHHAIDYRNKQLTLEGVRLIYELNHKI